MKLQFTLNGKPVSLEVSPEKRLLDILREDFGLMGTKEGCGEGECGSCTVLIDDLAAHACLTVAVQLMGKRVLTIEGLAEDDELSILQRCFVEETAVQCGYCTPGMILSAKALLLNNQNPTREEIRDALSGNLCRCSGYTQIVRAVERAAREMEAGA